MSQTKTSIEIKVENIDYFLDNVKFFLSERNIGKVRIKKDNSNFCFTSSYGKMSPLSFEGQWILVDEICLIRAEIIIRLLKVFRPLFVSLALGIITMNFSIYWGIFVLIGLFYSIFNYKKAKQKMFFLKNVIENFGRLD